MFVSVGLSLAIGMELTNGCYRKQGSISVSLWFERAWMEILGSVWDYHEIATTVRRFFVLVSNVAIQGICVLHKVGEALMALVGINVRHYSCSSTRKRLSLEYQRYKMSRSSGNLRSFDASVCRSADENLFFVSFSSSGTRGYKRSLCRCVSGEI